MFTLSLIITAGLSSFATYYYPKFKRVYIQRKRAKKQKLNELIRAEVERQIKEIIND